MEDQAYAVLQEDARRLLASRCAPCHDGSDRDGVPKAIAAFDVAAEGDAWSPGLDAGQLRFAREQLAEREATTPAELDRFDAFVEGELTGP